jgi:phenylacetate-CoA ligase
VVRSIPEIGNDYQVTVSKRGDIDDILLEIEMMPGMEAKQEEVLGRLKDQLRVRVNLGFKITVHPFGVVPRYEVKAKRFRDLRKH